MRAQDKCLILEILSNKICVDAKLELTELNFFYSSIFLFLHDLKKFSHTAKFFS